MKNVAKACLALCTLPLFLLAGCAETVSSLPESTQVSSAPQPIQVEEPTSLATEPAPLTGDVLVNDTADMLIELATQTGGESESPESATEFCTPGQSVQLNLRTQGFYFQTPEFEGIQYLEDLYRYSGVEDVRIVFGGDSTEGYTLHVFDAFTDAPVHQYILEPVQHQWQPVREGQKLFLMDLPKLPMDEVLALYPDAVLVDKEIDTGWPDYTMMLWCREPLYDLQLGQSSYYGSSEDYSILYLYEPEPLGTMPVVDLMPGAPLVIGLASVGSAWNLTLSFKDGNGTQYHYAAGENGMGGDWPSLQIYNVDGVEFVPYE